MLLIGQRRHRGPKDEGLKEKRKDAQFAQQWDVTQAYKETVRC